jgi:hypothetical protein
MHTLDQLTSGALAGARHVRLTCGLTEFPRALFALADTLELLDLSGNQLRALPDDLPRLHRLRILFASQNPFTTVPTVLGRMPQLEMVGFKACAISEVPAESLPPRLRWLILTDNAIEQLPESLGQRPRLQKLMLSCNRLSVLPTSLGSSPQLELLRLAGNRFTNVPAALHSLPQLAWPALAGNPLTQANEASASRAATPLAWGDLVLGPLLGQGASGQVFHAQQRASGEALAVKVFHAQATSDGTPQSELAAGLAAGRHAHLLTPLAPISGHPAGLLAMALPLLAADLRPLAGPPSLESCTRDVYADSAIAPSSALRLLADVASAVAHLHAHGVVHGDLYAHNILWRESDGHAVLSDLGAAMLTHHLPTADALQLQRVEMRALGILIAEVLAHSPQLGAAQRSALQTLSAQCQGPTTLRPSASQAAEMLKKLH